MTTYVEPANARLGDVVQDMVGFAFVTGEIVGIDTQGPAILVRWHDVQKRAMDVYSVDSPVWSCFGIVRAEPAATFETAYDGHQPGDDAGGPIAPINVSDPYVVEGIGLQQACTACHNTTECDGSCQHPAPIEPALDVPVLTLPWGNNDVA
jgi:hypothetical protein